MIATIVFFIVWLFPFAVGAAMVYSGLPPAVAFLVAAVLFGFVFWGFAAPSAGDA